MITWNQELYHSWGKSPKQKAREKEYNHWYYLRNKEKWLKKKIKQKSPVEVDRYKEKDEEGTYSETNIRDKKGVDVGVDVKETRRIAKKYSNRAKKNAKKIKKTASEHIANGKKKYEKFVNSNPPKNVDSETRKKVNRVAKSYSKSSRISEAKKYRTTKQIQKESGYSPKKLKTKQGRYSMDRENESRINTNKPGKINVYSSTDNWDERLKKKKKR